MLGLAQDLDVSAGTQSLFCVNSKKIIVLFLTQNLFKDFELEKSMLVVVGGGLRDM